jgi:hypothetical protein
VTRVPKKILRNGRIPTQKTEHDSELKRPNCRQNKKSCLEKLDRKIRQKLVQCREKYENQNSQGMVTAMFAAKLLCGSCDSLSGATSLLHGTEFATHLNQQGGKTNSKEKQKKNH